MVDNINFLKREGSRYYSSRIPNINKDNRWDTENSYTFFSDYLNANTWKSNIRPSKKKKICVSTKQLRSYFLKNGNFMKYSISNSATTWKYYKILDKHNAVLLVIPRVSNARFYKYKKSHVLHFDYFLNLSRKQLRPVKKCPRRIVAGEWYTLTFEPKIFNIKGVASNKPYIYYMVQNRLINSPLRNPRLDHRYIRVYDGEAPRVRTREVTVDSNTFVGQFLASVLDLHSRYLADKPVDYVKFLRYQPIHRKYRVNNVDSVVRTTVNQYPPVWNRMRYDLVTSFEKVYYMHRLFLNPRFKWLKQPTSGLEYFAFLKDLKPNASTPYSVAFQSRLLVASKLFLFKSNSQFSSVTNWINFLTSSYELSRCISTEELETIHASLEAISFNTNTVTNYFNHARRFLISHQLTLVCFTFNNSYYKLTNDKSLFGTYTCFNPGMLVRFSVSDVNGIKKDFIVHITGYTQANMDTNYYKIFDTLQNTINKENLSIVEYKNLFFFEHRLLQTVDVLDIYKNYECWSAALHPKLDYNEFGELEYTVNSKFHQEVLFWFTPHLVLKHSIHIFKFIIFFWYFITVWNFFILNNPYTLLLRALSNTLCFIWKLLITYYRWLVPIPVYLLTIIFKAVHTSYFPTRYFIPFLDPLKCATFIIMLVSAFIAWYQGSFFIIPVYMDNSISHYLEIYFATTIEMPTPFTSMTSTLPDSMMRSGKLDFAMIRQLTDLYMLDPDPVYQQSTILLDIFRGILHPDYISPNCFNNSGIWHMRQLMEMLTKLIVNIYEHGRDPTEVLCEYLNNIRTFTYQDLRYSKSPEFVKIRYEMHPYLKYMTFEVGYDVFYRFIVLIELHLDLVLSDPTSTGLDLSEKIITGHDLQPMKNIRFRSIDGAWGRIDDFYTYNGKHFNTFVDMIDYLEEDEMLSYFG